MIYSCYNGSNNSNMKYQCNCDCMQSQMQNQMKNQMQSSSGQAQSYQMPSSQMTNNQMSGAQMQNGTQISQMPNSNQSTSMTTIPKRRSKLAASNSNNMASSYALAPQAGNAPTTVESPYYTAGLLTNFIGQNMRVEFLIGTSGALVDRIGTLVEVGASYIILQPIDSDDLLICDLYSIKFVNVYR